MTKGVENKSIEELQACETKIARELKKKRDEKIITDGGFTCTVCGKVFEKKYEGRQGICKQDSMKIDYKEIKAFFEGVEQSKLSVFAIRFERRYSEDNSIIAHPAEGYRGGHKGEAKLHGLILVSEDGHYFELEVEMTGSGCGDDADIETKLLHRGTTPPEVYKSKQGSIENSWFRWPIKMK